MFKHHIIYLFFVFAFFKQVNSQEHIAPIKFRENKGQYLKNIDYKLEINEGNVYLENNKITYQLFNRDLISDIYHGKLPNTTILEGHSYSVSFANSLPSPNITASKKSTNYSNFFIGNDSAKWANNVFDFESVSYQNIYAGIDLKYYGHFGQVKYDFIVRAGANTDNIDLEYEGVNKLKIKNGHLFIKTNYGTLVEQSPYAYQVVNGKKKKIACKYVLKKNHLSFQFENDYNHNLDLIIDPVLAFATYTGSTASNFGCTATYDGAGNMYVGGTVFGLGYPTSTGAFQTTFSGGNIDMAITKFSSDGSTLLYSTYIGGSNNEIPHSLVVNNLNQLCIMGTSGSTNFPTTSGVYDNSFNGGPSLNLGNGYGFQYVSGCDIVVAKLNALGSSLIASTFVGGAGNDGINRNSELHYNYGDAFRGEIIVDNGNNIYIASTTSSTDFPLNGATQTTYGGGGLDACVFKLNGQLTNLMWSTYLGGSNFDCAYSVQLDSGGEIYVAGGTKSTNFTTTSNALNQNYQGGIADGFLTHYSANGSTVVASTYIGTAGYDQCFFVQADLDDNIFTVGQSNGNYPITAGTYNNPNSGQFIQKLPNDFSSSLVSTTIGTSSGEIDISISAFLVSDCNQIFISGWGGSTNRLTTLGALATQSTTNGLPITSPTFQSSTDGEDFYLMVLNEDAQALLYATYFGGGTSHEHVDGGTSRFDKNGKVYQAVCAGCGGNSDFPTSSGAWSSTNNSTNCNLGAFKFDLANITPTVSVPQPFVCLPSSYNFLNNSSGGNAYEWHFGDGATSNLFEPSHFYADTGNYIVELVVMDTTGCLANDTALLSVDVFMLDNAIITQTDTICTGDSTQLSASGGVSYQWTPITYISDPTIPNPIAFPPVTTTYQVITVDSCGTDTAQITIQVFEDNVYTLLDTTICDGNNLQLEAFGGLQYQWTPNINITNINIPNPVVSPTNTTTYIVSGSTIHGCSLKDSIEVSVLVDLGNVTPIINTSTPYICLPSQTQLENGSINGNQFTWNFGDGNSSNDFEPNYVYSDTGHYEIQLIVEDTTGCYGTDSTSIELDAFLANNAQIIQPDTLCPGDSAFVIATGGITYLWTPNIYISNPSIANPAIFPPTTSIYKVVTTDSCSSDTAFVTINVYSDSVYTTPDTSICIGESVTFSAFGALQYQWSSGMNMINPTNATQTLSPTSTTTFYVTGETVNGCILSDSIVVTVVLDIPSPQLPNDTLICKGDTIYVEATGATSYNWTPQNVLSNPGASSTFAYPIENTSIYVDFINACGIVPDSFMINVTDVYPNIVNDTIICPGDTANLWANNADYYAWSPTATLSFPDSSNTFATPLVNTSYQVICSNLIGCEKEKSVTVNIYPTPSVYAGNNQYVYYGVPINLAGQAEEPNIYWITEDSLSCLTCLDPILIPTHSNEYILRVEDPHGCLNYDTVNIFVNGSIYIPNTFSPNGDGINDVFKIKAEEILTFELNIFDRWGLLIFATTDLEHSWDGTYKGRLVQQDAYIWKVKYSDYFEKRVELIGHVNVLR